MLYSTLSQPIVFLCLFATGLLGGLAFVIISFFTRKNKIFLHVLQFFSICFCFLSFHLVNLFVNYGELRLFTIFAYLLGFFLINLLFSKFIAKILKKLYNFINGKRKKEKDC